MSIEISEPAVQAHGHIRLDAAIPTSELLLFCRDLRGTVTGVVVAAAGRALAAHPALGDAAFGVGVAVDTGDRVVVPVARNAAEAPLPLVRDEVERLLGAARSGCLSPSDLGGAAVTVLDPPPGERLTLTDVLPGSVLTVDRAASDAPELALAFSVTSSGVDGEQAGSYFATLVRLLRHPYRRLV